MSRPIRICFIGDSFVNGTGDPACLGWTGRVCASACTRGHDVTYYNLGVRRDTSTDIRRRWQAEVVTRLPREARAHMHGGALVFCFGVNDTTWEQGSPRVALEESLANATAILTEAQGLWPVLFVGPPPIDDDSQNGRIDKLSQALQRQAESASVPYLAVFDRLLQSSVWMREVSENDGAHPRANGYEVFADLVRDWPAWIAWFDY